MGKIESPNREKLILERILSLKQLLKNENGGPLELHELGVCYFHLDNFERTAEYLTNLLDKYPDYLELSAVHGLRILALIRDGEYKQSLTFIKLRLQVHEQDTRLLAMRGYIYEKIGRKKDAIQTHRRILELEPENINSLNSLGYLLTLYGKKSDDAEAYSCLKKALTNKPNHPAYLDSFGVFLAKKGETDSARRALVKALKRDPGSSDIMDHLKELLNL